MRQFSYIKKPSDIEGLLYIPSFQNEADNDSDSLSFSGPYPPREASPESFEFVCKTIKEMPSCKAIMEIGIGQNIKGFTLALTDSKKPETIYMGVDIEERRYLGSPIDNIFVMKSDSRNQTFVRQTLKEHKINQLSVLFIDGWHSVNTVINDFLYSDLVEKGGLIFFHDINFHPGPNLVFQSVDETLYEKTWLFDNPKDYGLGMLKKL